MFHDDMDVVAVFVVLQIPDDNRLIHPPGDGRRRDRRGRARQEPSRGRVVRPPRHKLRHPVPECRAAAPHTVTPEADPELSGRRQAAWA